MRDKDKLIELVEGFTANDYGEFLLNNSTKDFLFIRPSGNPIDASGFMKMVSSRDLSCDGYTDVKNSDLATVTTIIKKINNQWKLSWMQRSSGDSDLTLWDLYF